MSVPLVMFVLLIFGFGWKYLERIGNTLASQYSRKQRTRLIALVAICLVADASYVYLFASILAGNARW